MKDRGERCDLEAGMAKLYASESAQDAAVAAMSIVGPASQLTAGRVERLYRDTPLMIIGEGTNEIQRLIICANLLERYGERGGALIAREAEPDDRRQIVLAVRQLVDKEVIPVAHDDEATGRYPAALVEQLGELGVSGAIVSPDLGGLGLDLGTFVMIVEEVARGWATLAALVSAQAAACSIVARFGSARQRDRLVPSMTRGERRVAIVPGGSVNVRRDGEGWVLHGSATLVPGAGHADLYIVSARATDGRRSASWSNGDARGLTRSAAHDTLGGRGLEASDLHFDRVPSMDRRGSRAAPTRPRTRWHGSTAPPWRWVWPRPRSRPRCATRSNVRPSASPSASIRPSSSSSPTWRHASRQRAC